MSEGNPRSGDPPSTGPRTGRLLTRLLQGGGAFMILRSIGIPSSWAAAPPGPSPTADHLGGLVVAVVALLGLHALFAAAETALRSASRARMATLSEEGNRRAAYVLRLLEHPASFLTAIQVLKTILVLSIAVAAFSLAQDLAHRLLGSPFALPYVGPATVLAIFFVLLLFGEIIPKVIASQHPHRIALLSAWWIGPCTALIYPLFRAIDGLSRIFVSRRPGPTGQRSPMEAEEEIKMMAAGGVETGEIEPEEQEMIRGVLTATDKVAREVMVPRIDITAADADGTLDDLLDAVLNEGHSRIPIFEESIDRIIGIIHARDLLDVVRSRALDITCSPSSDDAVRPPADSDHGPATSDGRTHPAPEVRQVPSPEVTHVASPVAGHGAAPTALSIRDLPIRDLPIRAPYFIPENKRLLDLLSEFRESKTPIAIVVDEYGGTAGLVTLEDLLEEIVGEIADESDIEEEPFRRVDERTVVFDSRMPIDDVNEMMEINLPEEDFDTIGGFVFGQVGRLPTTGQSVQYDGVVLTVEQADGHRIRRVRVSKPQPDEPTDSSARSGEGVRG